MLDKEAAPGYSLPPVGGVSGAAHHSRQGSRGGGSRTGSPKHAWVGHRMAGQLWSRRVTLVGSVVALVLVHLLVANPMFSSPQGAGSRRVALLENSEAGLNRALVEQLRPARFSLAAVLGAGGSSTAGLGSADAATAAGGEPQQQQVGAGEGRSLPSGLDPAGLHTWKCSLAGQAFEAAADATAYWLSTAEYLFKFGASMPPARWCRGGKPSEVPQLRRVELLRSAKPRSTASLTIVTQLSLERFAMLGNQCRLWPHAISAVLYIPLVEGEVFSAEEPEWNKTPLQRGLDEARAFFASMEAEASHCALDLEVVVEERCERHAAMLYPANAARNRALLNVQTDMVLLLDVDFAVSRPLAALISNETAYSELLGTLRSGRAVVLPAFEPLEEDEEAKAVALEAVGGGNKTFILEQFEKQVLIGFHMHHYPQGHQATNFPRWFNTTQMYDIVYETGFEPYILMVRESVPFYDEQYRGYYWNKVSHLMHLSLQQAVTFAVHPSAFVVHVPHKKPSTKWLTRRSGQKEKNHAMFTEGLEDMRWKHFVPVTSFPELCVPQGERSGLASELAKQAAGEDSAAREALASGAVSERLVQSALLPEEQQQALAPQPPSEGGDGELQQGAPATGQAATEQKKL